MIGIPPIRCAEMLNEMETTQRAFLRSKEIHRREVRTGAIRTLLGIFCCRAIEAREDCIYLFREYRLE